MDYDILFKKKDTSFDFYEIDISSSTDSDYSSSQPFLTRKLCYLLETEVLANKVEKLPYSVRWVSGSEVCTHTHKSLGTLLGRTS